MYLARSGSTRVNSERKPGKRGPSVKWLLVCLLAQRNEKMNKIRGRAFEILLFAVILVATAVFLVRDPPSKAGAQTANNGPGPWVIVSTGPQNNIGTRGATFLLNTDTG